MVAARIQKGPSRRPESAVSLGGETEGLKVNDLVPGIPFISIRAMLIAIDPHKWLPYRYLCPFLWSCWDSRQALLRIANSNANAKPTVLILPAGHDVLVPE